MIQLTDAGKRFGPKILFQNLNWLITPRDRVGLVGANGTGKTTLLKVLAGIEGLDYGTITRQRGANAGYLPQDGLSPWCAHIFDPEALHEKALHLLHFLFLHRAGCPACGLG